MAVFPRSTKYTRPGSYLGQVFRPRPTALAGVTFRPCYVGKGHRLALTKNASVRRSWVEGEELAFTTAPPFIATLDYQAIPDQSTPISLYDQDGNEVAISKWSFYKSDPNSDVYDQILFNAADFDKLKTYYIDYQSASRTFLDPLPFSDPRRIIRVGLFPNQDLYQENLTPADEDETGDFVIPGLVDSFAADTGNENTDSEVSAITSTVDGGSTGTVVFGASTDPTNEYTKYYKLEVTGIAVDQATFKINSWLHSGGNGTGFQVPLTSGVADQEFTVETAGSGNLLPTNRLLMDGIYLTYDLGGSNFVVGDTFEFWSYGPGKFEAHSAYAETNEQFSSISAVAAAGNTDWSTNPPATADNTSNATFAAGSEAEYTDEFARHYKLMVTAAAGTAATGSLTFSLADISDNEHFTLNNGMESVTFEYKKTAGYTAVSGRVTVDISGAASDNEVATLTAAEINDDTNWTGNAEITAVPSLNVVNLTADNNGADANGAIPAYESDGTTVSTGITPVAMSGGQRTATVVWAGADELPYTTGSIALDDTTSTSYTNVTLEKGIKLTVTWPALTSTAFVMGDSWTFSAAPGRMYYHAKDDRVYTLTLAAAVDQTLSGTYAASTIEGGFSTFSATIEDNGSGGKVTLEDNVVFMARNAGDAASMPTGINAPTRHASGDVTTFAATCDDVIKWDIDQRVTETIIASSIIYDAIGTVTGTPGTYYLVLDDTPTSIISVTNATTSAAISYTWVTDSPYLWFSSDPGVNVAVKYQHRGNEPNPEQVYYVTGTRLRATTEYDTPRLWRTIDQARDGLQPSSIDNDILIGSEIGDESGALDEWYTIQARDLDDDGIYQLSDYKRAVQATEYRAGITDVCVLNQFRALGTAIQEVENANDMFNYPSKVRMLWVGMPANSPVGDADTADSIIYTAKRTLQVSGNSPSHGCHVLIGNTWATREVVLDDASTKTITVDGSFIAAAAMAKQDGFTDVGDTLLYKTLGGVFTEMETFSDAEMRALGGSNITFLDETGDGIYRFEEDITVDGSAIDYMQINAMKQKHFVIRNLTQQAGEKLTGYVPPDPFAALALIRSYIAEVLGNFVAAGVIAPYGSEQNPPTRRAINPSQDVLVYQDENIKTDYFYVFYFNLRYPVKRTTGLFGVDSDEILKGVARVV